MAYNIITFPAVTMASVASVQGYAPLDLTSLGYVGFGIVIGVLASSSQVISDKKREPHALRDSLIASAMVALFNAFLAMILIEYVITNYGAPRTALTAIGIAMVIGALGPKVMELILDAIKSKFNKLADKN